MMPQMIMKPRATNMQRSATLCALLVLIVGALAQLPPTFVSIRMQGACAANPQPSMATCYVRIAGSSGASALASSSARGLSVLSVTSNGAGGGVTFSTPANMDTSSTSTSVNSVAFNASRSQAIAFLQSASAPASGVGVIAVVHGDGAASVPAAVRSALAAAGSQVRHSAC